MAEQDRQSVFIFHRVGSTRSTGRARGGDVEADAKVVDQQQGEADGEDMARHHAGEDEQGGSA
ncbi:hypothetical protein ACJX0J_042444, partial [Zea mays]